MNFEIDQKFAFYGRIDTINPSTYDSFAVNVTGEDKEKYVVRIPLGTTLQMNKIYYFETVAVNFKDKIHLRADVFKPMAELNLPDVDKERLMRAFYQYAPVGIAESRKVIEGKLSKLKNPTIKKITMKLYRKFEDQFYLYPAATKFHHAYISGLAYHTASMLRLAEGFLKVYPFLNEDLLMAGIVLHDVTKVLEFDSFEGSEYTTQGRLIGHISMGAAEVAIAAKELKLADTEEAMLLEHIIISHHYFGNFGSPKKPNIAEALAIHFIDNIDSKICVLGEELDTIGLGEFTQPIGVLDKERYYKHKITK